MLIIIIDVQHRKETWRRWL